MNSSIRYKNAKDMRMAAKERAREKEKESEPQIANFEWWCLRSWRVKRGWVSVVGVRCRVFMYCSVLVEDLFGFFPLVRSLIMNSISFHSTTLSSFFFSSLRFLPLLAHRRRQFDNIRCCYLSSFTTCCPFLSPY